MKAIIIHSVIGLIFIILSICHAYKIRGKDSPPEIWLTSFMETDSFESIPAEPEFRTLAHFENELISKNGSDYVVQEDANTAVYTCQARYPVKWTIPHMKHVENAARYTFETYNIRTSDIQNGMPPENKYFQSILTISFLNSGDFLSVNLTCGKHPNDEVFISPKTTSSSSIYVFSTLRHLIENKGNTIQVYIPPIRQKDYGVSSSSSQLILPCRPASPNVTILLEHEFVNGDNTHSKNKTLNWDRIRYPTRNFKFDPKVGFILTIYPGNSLRLFIGLYKCTALEEGDEEADQQEDDNNQQFIYVNVTSEKGNMTGISEKDVQFQPIFKSKGGAILSYNNQIFGKRLSSPPIPIDIDEGGLMCCSGVDERRPIIYDSGCSGYLQCDIIKWSMIYKIRMNTSEFGMYEFKHAGERTGDPSDCLRTYLFSSNVVYCEDDNIQFMNQLVTVFNKELFPVSNRPRQRKVDEDGRKYTLYGFETESNARNTDISQKILLTIGHPSAFTQISINDARLYTHNFGFEVGQELGESLQYTDSDWEPVKVLPEIWEYPRDHFYEGEPLIGVCLGWSYLYSHGAHLTINFNNGSRGMVISEKNNRARKMLHFRGANWGANFYVQQEEIVYSIGNELIANKDMVSVECWMPQWNTKDWDKVTRNITVLEAIRPSFVGDEEEDVIFYLGEEEDKELKCLVLEGAPEPKITVSKDGKEILKGYEAEYYRKYFDSHFPDEMFYEGSLFNITLEQDNSTTGEGSIIPSSTTGNLLVKIMFNPGITHEMQGVYQCTAENIGGIVRKRYRVVVAEKRTVLLPIVLTTTIGCSLAIIAIMVIRHWRQRQQLESLRNR